jgi:predicted transcriptional regulator with HTH domain
LLGSEFSVVCQTDHRPLQHFLTQSNLSARQVRWQTFLTDYNLEVQYLPGNENVFADGLSKRSDLRLLALASLSPYDNWLARITKVCESDPEAGKLRKLARNENRNTSEQYVLRLGVLLWSARGLLRVNVPISLRLSLIKEFHDTAISGHFGTRKTYAAIAQHYYWW